MNKNMKLMLCVHEVEFCVEQMEEQECSAS